MECWLRPPPGATALPERSNDMTPRTPEEISTSWSVFVIMGNTMPPRDPDEDEEDDDEEEEDRDDEPPVVREPDEAGTRA
jgi:hypothetical protein